MELIEHMKNFPTTSGGKHHQAYKKPQQTHWQNINRTIYTTIGQNPKTLEQKKEKKKKNQNRTEQISTKAT